MNEQNPNSENRKNPHFPDRHIYPASEDIYNQFKEEADIDPENPTKMKEFDKAGNQHEWNEKHFGQDKSGSDLDIPGSELDDEQELIGSEDEENNGYSLGGDNHQDLEETHEDL